MTAQATCAYRLRSGVSKKYIVCFRGGMCLLSEVAGCYIGGSTSLEGGRSGKKKMTKRRKEEEAALRRIFCTADKRKRKTAGAPVPVRAAAMAEGDGRRRKAVGGRP